MQNYQPKAIAIDLAIILADEKILLYAAHRFQRKKLKRRS